MNIEPAFFCPLAVDILTNIDNDALKKYAVSLKSQSSGKQKSNKGGWQSEDFSGYVPELNELFVEILKRVNQLHETVGYTTKYSQGMYNAWININSTGHYNDPHTHPKSTFSGVYYIDTQPDSGNIVFMNPQAYMIDDTDIETHTPFLSARRFYPPENGKLIIFPSWLMHYVERNNNSAERISLSFNTFINKD